MSASAASWVEVNQQALSGELQRVRAYLERFAEQPDSVSPGACDTTGSKQSTGKGSDPSRTAAVPALDQLTTAFGLSAFERDVLLLCAGLELESSFSALCASAHGDQRQRFPTFSLALAAMPGAHWSALVPTAPLRRWRMIEIGDEYTLTRSPLRIDERVLHYLTGVQHLDERLAGVVDPITDGDQLTPSQRAVAEQAAAYWHDLESPALPVINLRGDDRYTATQLAADVCSRAGLSLYTVRADSIPIAASERETFRRLWEREAILTSSALLLDCTDLESLDPGQSSSAMRLAHRLNVPLMLASRSALPEIERQTRTVDVPKPGIEEQRAILENVFGDVAARANGHLDRLVSQFNLNTPAIRAAESAVQSSLDAVSEDELGRRLWDAMREQSRPRLGGLAQRIEPAAEWEDLVLPGQQRQVLRDIAVHVRQRATVYERWGFASKGGRGLGISALFAGSSGTGKTMAAEVLANELRLDLYRIDLSSVVSKFIGETEKNLRQVFDAAEAGGAILLFDEADALFGKRSEVKDSHDRYANIEVSYLLQRMEAYQGLAILTTNLKSALDPAFLRRIRFVVQFPFPDAEQRAQIWEGIFPSCTPTYQLDAGKLARLNVSGGTIRNIALNAAFLAADAGESVRMIHVLRAARAEYAKLEKTLTESEIQGWE